AQNECRQHRRAPPWRLRFHRLHGRWPAPGRGAIGQLPHSGVGRESPAHAVSPVVRWCEHGESPVVQVGKATLGKGVELLPRTVGGRQRAVLPYVAPSRHAWTDQRGGGGVELVKGRRTFGGTSLLERE